MLGAISAGALLQPGSARADAAVVSLKDVARSRGLIYGAQSDVSIPAQPPAYGDLFIKHCAVFSPAKVTWGLISPREGVDNFDHDPNVAWAVSKGFRLTVGHLLWQEHIPGWVSAKPTDRQFSDAVLNHITNTCRKFPGNVFSWNVVNEAIEPKDGRPDGLLNSEFMQRMGPDFFEEAFHAARNAAPKAMLVYNDYGFEINSILTRARRSALLKLVAKLKSHRAPIDAVGLQTHLRAADMPHFDERSYADFLSDLASLGVKIMITELDALDVGTPQDFVKRDNTIADAYHRVLSVALDQRAVMGVITWGLVDRFSWYNLYAMPAEKVRADHAEQRPLPFDDHFLPTGVYWALEKALRGAPSRQFPPNF